MALGPEQLAEAAAEAIAPLLKAQQQRIEALEARLAEAEAKTMRFSGTWQKAADYKRGAAVVFDGSLWVCTRPTNERPGSGDGWQMAIKSGRSA